MRLFRIPIAVATAPISLYWAWRFARRVVRGTQITQAQYGDAMGVSTSIASGQISDMVGELVLLHMEDVLPRQPDASFRSVLRALLLAAHGDPVPNQVAFDRTREAKAELDRLERQQVNAARPDGDTKRRRPYQGEQLGDSRRALAEAWRQWLIPSNA